MNFRTRWVLLRTFLFAPLLSYSSDMLFPNFVLSMIRQGNEASDQDFEYTASRKRLFESANPNYVEIFQNLYEQTIQEAKNTPLNASYRIPRIVHQIWLGGKVPEKYRDWMESWLQLKGWEYWLWTDEDVSKFKMYNRDLYDQSQNYGEQSDILRLEILYRYGGLYVDTDFECIKPEFFDDLHRCLDFYIAFEPLEHGFVGKFNMFKVCNAIIGAIPEHPFIQDLITNMKANYFAYRPYSGPLGRTGPNYLTRILCEYVETKVDDFRNGIFPTTVFYPFSAIDIAHLSSNPEMELPQFPETIAIHYWNMSWVKNKNYR